MQNEFLTKERKDKNRTANLSFQTIKRAGSTFYH